MPKLTPRQKLTVFAVAQVIVPATAAYAGTRAGYSEFQTWAITLLSAGWANTVLLALNAELFSGPRPSIDALLAWVRDEVAATHLKSIEHLQMEIAEENGFRTTGDALTRFLVKHHMESYAFALRATRADQTLPLPSEPRMACAAEAIREATREILAISTEGDYWREPPVDASTRSTYLTANLDKARAWTDQRPARERQPTVFRRVFIYEDPAQAREKANDMQEQADAGIEVRYVTARQLHAALAPEPADVPNLLICDGRFMSRSVHSNTHFGIASMNPSEIARYRNLFERIWDKALPVAPGSGRVRRV